MKKIDIMNLIESNLTILKNQELISSIKLHKDYFDIYHKEEPMYPDIQEFNNDFNILKREYLAARNASLESENNINNLRIKCTHDVRLCYHYLFFSNNKCVLCGKDISSDNCFSFKESNYRNKHTVTFDSRYQEDEDEMPYEITDGKTIEEVLLLIKDLIKDYNDNDDIDLVDIFNQDQVANADINLEKRKQEKYVLIIGGTNKEFIDDNQQTYISNLNEIDSYYFYNYFKSLLNTKVAIIDNNETFSNKQYVGVEENNNTYLKSYTSIKSLNYTLKSFNNITFDLIINVSSLIKYSINSNQIITSEYTLNLSNIFPNTHVINIKIINNQEDLNKIKNTIGLNNIIYDQDKNQFFYYVEKNELLNNNMETTCQKIKKLIINQS